MFKNFYNILKKRKPNYLIVNINNYGSDVLLSTARRLFTYSIKPYKKIDNTIIDIKKFIKKYPEPLKYIVISCSGGGKKLIETKEPKEKTEELLKSLEPLINSETKIIFETCFSGSSHRKVVEFSERMGFLEVYALLGDYDIFLKKNKVIKCKCKESGYSENVLKNIRQSEKGLRYDEVSIIYCNMGIRQLGSTDKVKINWETCGMAHEYNEKVIKDGICVEEYMPKTTINYILNYLFNIQY